MSKDREELPRACDIAPAIASEGSFMLKRTAALKQPAVSHLIQDLRHLMGLTQEQFASTLGVTFTTINRWENAHIQPSSLALKQIKLTLEKITLSPEREQSEQGYRLLSHYFSEAPPNLRSAETHAK